MTIRVDWYRVHRWFLCIQTHELCNILHLYLSYICLILCNLLEAVPVFAAAPHPLRKIRVVSFVHRPRSAGPTVQIYH